MTKLTIKLPTVTGDKKYIDYEFAFSENSLVAAHKHSIFNYDEIMASDKCGCFYCLRIFTPNKIDEWLKEISSTNAKSGYTVFCICGLDTVIGSASGFPITRVFLQDMHIRWF